MIRILTEQETTELYHRHMEADFPREELKPLPVILDMRKRGIYEAVGYFDKGLLQGYAMLEVLDQDDYVLLDFYAICAEYRNSGIGSIFLKELLKRYDRYRGVIAEVEIPSESRDESEAALRRRRIVFYERAGFDRIEGIRYILFGVPYTILLYGERSGQAAASDIVHALEKFYRGAWKGEEGLQNITIELL